MPDLSLLTTSTVITFLLILIRVSGMMISAPLFSLSNIPAMAKIGLAFGLSMLMFSLHAGAKGYHAPKDLIAFGMMAGQEILIGLMIGFTAELVFTGIRMAGELISVQMGISVATVLDPTTHTPNTLLSQIYFILAVLVFLSLNIHHGLIAAVSRSFDWIPLGQPLLHMGMLTNHFIEMSQEMLGITLLLAVPVMGVLLVLDIALSFVAKVMPQMNIFIVAMPLKVGLGLFLIMLSMPFAARFLADQYAVMVQHMLGLFRA